MLRIGVALVASAAVCLLGFSSYRVLISRLEADVYRARLVEVRSDFDALRAQYDEAVRRTAVTELVVADGRLRVVIRTAQGALRSIETPFDPSREIYVDYVVVDGRLWIRRVFDNATPPKEGLVIDPELADVDWTAEGARHGKAAYRELGEGHWVVTVTGQGTLGLARRDPLETALLEPAPPVRSYPPAAEQARDDLREIGVAELVEQLARELGAGLD